MTPEEVAACNGDTTTAKRGRGQTGGSSFLQRQRSFHSQLSRINTSKVASPPMSPPPVQRTFARPSRNTQHHSRQSSANTESSSVLSQGADSGIGSAGFASPELHGRGADLSRTPQTTVSSQPPSSPPAFAPLTYVNSARSIESLSPQGVTSTSSAPHSRPQQRHASTTRNEPIPRTLQNRGEVESIADFALEHVFASVWVLAFLMGLVCILTRNTVCS